MRDYFRTAGLIFNQPLMVHEGMLDRAAHWANQVMSLNIVNLSVQNGDAKMMDDDYRHSADTRAARMDEQRRQAIASTGVAVIPVHGVLVSRGTQMNPCETMTNYEDLRTQLNQALADPAVEHIALDLDSPGGSTSGAFELADDIFAARTIKPITAIVNFNAYSAGYLMAAAASDVVISRTSGVGSIGVIAKHVDMSKRLEQQGVKVTTVYAGAHKNDLTPNEPISDQSMAFLQDLVQGFYEQFVNAVAQYRGLTVDAVRATEAGVFSGQRGIDMGLADRIETPQTAVNRIAASVQQRRAERAPRTKIAARASAMAMQITL
ncbi:S49 family peptidase [Collimonas humicola]|uniref:S49 family peptidase n=1 Tax=Collimonas humicola TaxID=2825886 RepID=UPI001B8D7BF3|nr:S49 family peptidase [Collimonas humicola]